MKVLFYILPFCAGITITTQAAINSQLRFAVYNPWVAAFISFLVGTVVLGVYILVTRQAFPAASAFSNIEWYKFTGGLLGSFFVTAIIFSIPQIGSANVFALVIAGQLFTALIYDHFGLLGMPQSSISLTKVLGVGMMVAGSYLINKR